MVLNFEIVVAAVVVLGIAAQWLAWRVKLPSIVFLLILGLLGGPVTGIITPDQWLGPLLAPIVSLSVAIILFEGGLTLRFHELRLMGSAFWLLVSLGSAITFVLVSIAAYYVANVPWDIAGLIGAICTVTGPTVIAPMLRAIHPRPHVASLLRWEGIVVDPIGAILAVLVFELIFAPEAATVQHQLLALIFTGVLASLFGAYFLKTILLRHWVPWYLRSVVTLAMVIFVFVGSNYFAHESGLLAVTLMGMLLANMKKLDVEDILSFKENITLMLVSVLFIVLAARLNFHDFLKLSWGLPFFLICVLAIRPIAVFASMVLSKYTLNEKLIISWIAPRGIVAASVASLFAIQLQKRGVEGADQLVPIIFSVIILTVMLQSLTAPKLAIKLGVAEAEPKGILVLGGSEAMITLAKVLTERGFHFLFASPDWSTLKDSRMAGYPTYHGRLLSDHAEQHIDLTDLGYLLAVSSNADQNSLACLRFRQEFGSNAVVSIRPQQEKASDKHQMSQSRRAERLFAGKLSSEEWDDKIRQGWQWRVSKLSPEYTFAQYNTDLPPDSIITLAINNRGRLRFFTEINKPQPQKGWTVIALVPKPEPKVEVKAEAKADTKAES